ncbi:MAG: beta-ketoacyl-ACP synthase [Candidatus Accumulibacter sp.]|jgi:3-oxoacyl-[acyl-carrier-protein] synthase II|nr:beta-ketoacyl-ACP synthase [Accumulibacter sp.]
MRRVVVTGMGGVTALGCAWETIEERLRGGVNAVRRMPEWDYVENLNTRLGAPIDDFRPPLRYPRKLLRSMGRVSLLSVCASEKALADSGSIDDPSLGDGRTGIAYGSSSGSVAPVCAFGRLQESGSMRGVTSTSYIQMMPHTAAVNVGVFFGLRGRIIPTSSTCVSGSQGIGYACEAIRFGRQDAMLAGGAEELSVSSAAVFDTLFATSCRNDSPKSTPRPFDKERDGLVVGEGAATLFLEEYARAKARGARIYAEIVGFSCNSDGRHVTQPDSAAMTAVMRQALDDAGIPASEVAYVSAHGTATDRGDAAEALATASVFGSETPISSMKSYIGHTLGACGAIEAWWCVEMLRRGWFAPTINLGAPDPACAALDHIVGEGRNIDAEYAVSNNFAFGGINTSLVFRRI